MNMFERWQMECPAPEEGEIGIYRCTVCGLQPTRECCEKYCVPWALEKFKEREGE